MVGLLLLQRAAETRGIQPTLPAAAFYPPFPGLELMTADEPFRFVALGLILPPIGLDYRIEGAFIRVGQARAAWPPSSRRASSSSSC